MGLLKNYKETKRKIDEIHKVLVSNVYKKAQKYDELMSYLDKISLTIDKIVEGIDDFGNTKYFITYKTPELIQEFDHNGEVIKNDFLYSVNMLNLIDLKDMQLISELFEKEKYKKSKKTA